MGGRGENDEGGGRYRAKMEMMPTHMLTDQANTDSLTCSNTDIGNLVKKLDKQAQESQSAHYCGIVCS